jgi:signal transduction protein with GAF and PtsI domain
MPQALAALIKNRERIAALKDADLLDTGPEEAFDQLARLAAKLVDAPVALVSLIDEDRQYFKSCIGDLPNPGPWGAVKQTPLSHSFCQYVVASRKPLVIEDSREHPLVKDNPAIRDLGVIAYLGVPLVTTDGHGLGSLCVIDSKPRKWTEAQIDTLRSLADAVMTTISLRSAARKATGSQGGGATAGAQVAPTDREAIHEAADELNEAVCQYLNWLDEYDHWIRNHEPTPNTFKEEAERREQIAEGEAEARRAVQHFQEQLGRRGNATSAPEVRAAVELTEACIAYFEAEARRRDASQRFQQLRTALDEVEREVVLAARAEQALRAATQSYEQATD